MPRRVPDWLAPRHVIGIHPVRYTRASNNKPARALWGNRMKRSAYIRLAVLGASLSLTACDQAPQTLKQQRYASLQECQDDWADPGDCTPEPGSGPYGGFYLGPRYYWDPIINRPRAVMLDGSERTVTAGRMSGGAVAGGETHIVGSIARGGFGGLGRGFGGGE
jgi:hypothetical protein